MALSRSLIRAFAGLNKSHATGVKNPVELTNEYILQNHDNSNMFVTLSYGVLDLASGDLLVFGGPSRRVFHGVPKVYDATGPDGLGLPPGRLSITVRETGLA